MTFCSCAVVAETKTNTVNLLGEKLNFEINKKKDTENDENANEIAALVGDRRNILINQQSRILETDLMATNGVVHVVETILETDSGKFKTLPLTLNIFTKLFNLC